MLMSLQEENYSPDNYWCISAWEIGRPSSLHPMFTRPMFTWKFLWFSERRALSMRKNKQHVASSEPPGGRRRVWAARGPVIDESTSQTFKWPSRDNHRMIPQRTVCCLGSLGEKINMRHILYGQDKQLWFS